MSKSTNSYTSLFKATGLFAGVQGINILLNLLRTKLVAIFLGPEGVGLNGIFNETKELIHETTNCGMDQSSVRSISIAHEGCNDEVSRQRLADSIKLTRSLVVLLALAGTALCAFFSWSLSYLTFNDSDHILDYIYLSPAVGMATISCGEMAILKGTRLIKKIATLSTLTIIVGLITNIPLYYFYGINGVIPAILLFSFVQMLVVMKFSFAEYAPQYCFSKSFLLTGKPMLVLGAAFVLQGFIAHLSRLAIQSYINTNGNLSDVGYYTSTLLIISVFMSVFASSLTSDFFPRLSAAFSDMTERHLVVCRQTDVLQMFTAPCLTAFLISINFLVPLLLDDKFMPIVPVLEIAMITLLVRSIALPLQYLPLAAGDSKTYLVVEIVAYGMMIPLYVGCYSHWGLMGLGYGIFIFNLLDMLWAIIYAKYKYGIMPSRRNILFFILQTMIISIAFAITRYTSGTTYILSAPVVVAASCALSYYLYQHTKTQ